MGHCQNKVRTGGEVVETEVVGRLGERRNKTIENTKIRGSQNGWELGFAQPVFQRRILKES